MADLLIGNIMRSAVHRTPQRAAVTHHGHTLTYAEVADRSEHIAAVLAARGVSKGARVVWWGATTVDAVPLYFALALLGAVLVPINPAFSREEAVPIINRADPELVLVDESRPGTLTQGDVMLSEVLAQRRPSVHELAEPAGDDPQIIFFTSGTTGPPKGVVLSHKTQLARALLKGASPWPLGPTVCMFPQFHMAGWLDPLAAWVSGDEVIYIDGGDPDAILAAIEHHRAYRLYCIPAVWRRILEVDPKRYNTSSLRHADTGTSAVSMELLEQVRETFPQTTTSITYGSTEAGVVCQLWPEDVFRKPGSVGAPAPGVFLRLQDGELLVRGPYLMTGYFRDEAATAAVMEDGWYHTGELAEIDHEGQCRIVGRVKDTIRTGGESVAPAEVDLVLQSHPDLLDAAVAGVPDEDRGEIVTAFVVPRPGANPDVAVLRSYSAGRLANYKHPRRMVVVDSIPRTSATGQVQRRALVQAATASAESGFRP